MLREEILRLLQAGEAAYLSGEKMSRSLGVTRAAVWKAIESLRSEGYVISSVTNRGYRLEQAPDRLTEADIRPFLRGGAEERLRLICLDSVDSTNSYAKRLALEPGADGTVVLAEEQTGGRGRYGRSFLSPKGRGVYLSALFTPRIPPDRLPPVTLYAAEAVCDAVEEVCGVRPGIKWTNDILLDGKKLCGILTELSVESESGLLQSVVVGIGTNVNHRPEDFSEEVRPLATSLAIHLGRPVSRAAFAGALVNRLEALGQAVCSGARLSLDRYRADCVTLGRDIRILQGDQIRFGRAMDIDDGGALLVRRPDGGMEALNYGEVSVRGMYGYV